MFQNIMVQIFGTYTPVDGGTNWEYVGSVILFGLCLYCTFRLAGQVFKK